MPGDMVIDLTLEDDSPRPPKRQRANAPAQPASDDDVVVIEGEAFRGLPSRGAPPPQATLGEDEDLVITGDVGAVSCCKSGLCAACMAATGVLQPTTTPMLLRLALLSPQPPLQQQHPTACTCSMPAPHSDWLQPACECSLTACMSTTCTVAAAIATGAATAAAYAADTITSTDVAADAAAAGRTVLGYRWHCGTSPMHAATAPPTPSRRRAARTTAGAVSRCASEDAAAPMRTANLAQDNCPVPAWCAAGPLRRGFSRSKQPQQIGCLAVHIRMVTMHKGGFVGWSCRELPWLILHGFEA